MAELMFPIVLQALEFTPNGRRVLKGVDLILGGAGITAVLGPNGAGKSVLLRMIAGLERVDGGAVSWGGASKPSDRIAFLFQRPMMLRASVADNIGLSLQPLGLERGEARERVADMLAKVGLAGRARDSARHLSGGERQRLALARAWIVRPRLLLLDEPTAALDPTATEAVEHLIRDIHAEGTRIVMTTHNLGQAQRLCDDVVFIADGLVREQGPTSLFFVKPQSPAARLFIDGELPWRLAFEP